MFPIAVDAMAGDHGPDPIIEGALAAARDDGVPVVLVGREERLRGALPGGTLPERVRIVAADDVMGMDDAPTVALRHRGRLSIRVAAGEVAAGRAAALFSAGNTGGTVMAAHEAFGMLAGVDRPALAATVPTCKHAAVLLDVGANVQCRPQHLVQFAAMGAVFARVSLGVAVPRVGLLSIGEEESKGNELTREAHHLLKASGLNFIGNIEARDVYAGDADVIVCDGFTGNIALKISEGLVEMVGEVLEDALARLGAGSADAPACHAAFDLFRKRVDYSESGGAPLLGVAGLTLVGHGRSSSKAVRHGVTLAHRFAAAGLIARIQQDIHLAGVR
jgi:glycerol-3-phosphate acyltransferase PlsX